MGSLLAAVVMLAAPTASVDGGLTIAQVGEVVTLRQPSLAPCFGTPGAAKATVRYGLSIAPDGRVAAIAFRDAKRLEGPQITCVGAALERWLFPARPDAGTAMEWTFSAPRADAGVSWVERTVPLEEHSPWHHHAAWCYARVAPPRPEGLVELEAMVAPSGLVAEAQVTHLAPALATTALGACLEGRARAWSFTPEQRWRRALTRWTFANTERRANLLFDPARPGDEVISGDVESVNKELGGLDKSVIYAVIAANSRHVKFCYEQALFTQPTLAGKLSVAWTIGADGRVVSTEPREDSLGVPALTTCVRNVVERMVFPPPHGGGVVNVTFPWLFKVAAASEPEEDERTAD